jgi:hypothetical protein
MAGEFPMHPLRPIARSTPVRRQGKPQTKRRTCDYERANESLLTDVSRLRSYRCTIIASITSDGTRGEDRWVRLPGLTGDIRG